MKNNVDKQTKVSHTKGIGNECFPFDDNCIWDADRGEYVTREHYDKLVQLRKKHKDWYDKSYSKELSCINIVANADKRLGDKLLASMPANAAKKHFNRG